MIYESLRRSRAMWENIRVYGLDICGMTYEQFCDQCDKKKNIVFLSDDEVEDFNKAIEIMKVMRSWKICFKCFLKWELDIERKS